MSLGTYSVARTDDREECLHYIAAHEPRECVLHMDMPGASQRKETLEQSGYTVSLYDGVRDAATYVKKTLGVQHLDIYGAVVIAGADHALALLWSYVVGVQYQPLTPVHKISTHRQDRSMLFDTLTRDNLEIFSSRYGGLQEHTLYAVINTTRTSM